MPTQAHYIDALGKLGSSARADGHSMIANEIDRVLRDLRRPFAGTDADTMEREFDSAPLHVRGGMA